MKKIIIIISILGFLTSCGTKKLIEDETSTGTTQTEINQSTGSETQITEGDENVNINNIDGNTKVNNTKDTKTDNTGTDTNVVDDNSTSTKTNPDEEAALEKEVNNLLDEFINSLDTYDK